MATNFPTSLDTYTNPTSTDTLASPDHAGQHANINDAVKALEAKVGVDGSAVTTSLDYKVTQRVALSTVTTKGDLIVGTANATVSRLGAGTDGYVLAAASGQSTGLQYIAPWTTANTTFTAPIEAATVSASAATGTIAFDVKTQSVLYYTANATANWTLNIRGNSGTTLASTLAVGQSITVVFLVTNGTTAYYQTGFQIDGSAVTPKWQNGTAPSSGNASSIDVYVFTVIKTASAPTYTVLGSQTKFA
jgi:hypothetical protein